MAHPGVHITRNFKSTKVDISDLEAELCNRLIADIHEQVFFTNKVYCRGVLDIRKLVEEDNKDYTAGPEPTSPFTSTSGDKTPGGKAQIVSESKNKISSPKEQSNEKSNENVKPKADRKITSPPKIPGLAVSPPTSKKGNKKRKKQLAKSDFLIKTRDGELHEEDFVFDDHNVSEQSSDDENKGFFKRSPLDLMPEKTDVNSRSSKITKKEELWNQSLKKAGVTIKRSLEVSPEDERRTRSKSVSLN